MLVLLIGLALVVLIGPFVLGMVAGRTRGAVSGTLFMLGLLFPPTAWSIVWLAERMTSHADNWSSYNDGDLGIIVAGYASIPAILLSAALTLFGHMLGTRRERGTDGPPIA